MKVGFWPDFKFHVAAERLRKLYLVLDELKPQKNLLARFVLKICNNYISTLFEIGKSKSKGFKFVIIQTHSIFTLIDQLLYWHLGTITIYMLFLKIVFFFNSAFCPFEKMAISVFPVQSNNSCWSLCLNLKLQAVSTLREGERRRRPRLKGPSWKGVKIFITEFITDLETVGKVQKLKSIHLREKIFLIVLLSSCQLAYSDYY